MVTTLNIKSRLWVLFIISFLYTLTFAQAQPFPSKPIKLIVSFAPGGAVDLVARKLSKSLGDHLGQSMVVDNKPGASGNIGGEFVSKSTPDGYTLLFAPSTLIANPLVMKDKIPFDFNKDLSPVSLIASGPLLMLVNQKEANSVSDFISKAKSNPKRFNFGTGGFGAAGHLSAEWFKQSNALTGVEIILYKGTAPALNDLLGGQLTAMMEPTLSALPALRTSMVKALAITSNKRDALFPEVPTFLELGYKDMEFMTWYGVWGPANMPSAITSKLSESIKFVLTDAEFNSWLKERGYESNPKSGSEFINFIETESKLYAKIVKLANIKAE